MNTNLKTFLLAATLALDTTAAHGQVIHIQSTVTLPPNQDVHLADIATISNTDTQTAEALAGTVILSSLSKNHTLKTEAILMAVISQQGPGVCNRLQVSGSAQCEITLGQPGGIPAPASAPLQYQPSTDTRAMAMTPTSLDLDAVVPAAPAGTAARVQTPASKSPPVLTASALPALETPDTLAKLISAKIAQDLQASPEDLRITFDTVNPAIDEPITPGKSWRIRSLSHPLIGNVQFEANLIDGNRMAKKILLSVRIEKHVRVPVAAMDIARGDLMCKNQFMLQDAYIDRAMPTVFSKEADIIGLEAQREVAAGTMLDKRDFKAAQLVARNDQVTVICIAGSLQVSVTGRASDNGKLHDIISVKNEKTGEIYQATIIGKGLAVVGGTPDEAQEKLLRETHS